MNFKKTYVVLLLLVTQFSFSQDGIPVYHDYLSDNLYLLHPSMAGAASHNQVRLTARQQWFGELEAPNLQTLSFNARLGEKSGFGAIVYNDKNGFHSQSGGYITYAYHLMFSRTATDLNQLSFGLSAGFSQSNLNESTFLLSYPTNDSFDQAIFGGTQSASYFNIDASLSYNFLNFSSHVTVKNLILQNRDLYDPRNESNNQRRYLVSAGYAMGSYGSDWSYEPSVLFQYSEGTAEKSVDVNFKLFRSMDFGKIWAALSYRRSLDGAEYLQGGVIDSQQQQLITPVLGVNYNNFLFAYTYGLQLGDVQFNNGGGFHQITLGYDFLGNRPEPYDCNCPAIN